MRNFLFLIFLVHLPACLGSYEYDYQELEQKPKLCLNMIVKNESRVIKRCLDSVKPLIDYWVIVDTGSTDDTQQIILEHMRDLPGELYERPWKNFGDSRTEAFELARGKGDYILFMDADDLLEYEPDFDLTALDQDEYMMWRGSKEFSYLKPQIVRGDLPWRWVGVTHEYLACDCNYTSALLEGIRYLSGDGGARAADPKKFHENIRLLKKGLEDEPDNARYIFYLAESYRDAGKRGRALEWYQKRVDRGGWAEEVFWSMLQIGHLLQLMHLPDSMAIDAYKQAFFYRPHRVEPVYYLAELYNRQQSWQNAYDWIKLYGTLPQPPQKDALFNQRWIEDYGLLFQLSICAYYVGQYRESLDACDQLLLIDNLPEAWRLQAKLNRKFPQDRLESVKTFLDEKERSD